ncbi:MAG TPA: DUF4184 family protein [Chthonomonadaceae bacterium]|nr:DUF4184 family protein [Chthonomonadaceae bacterium]
MPFTLSHPAAAVPFARLGLPLSALVIGSMAPDFPYFVQWTAHFQLGHTVPGLLLFDLPAGLAALALFHGLLKWPLVALMPPGHLERLARAARGFQIAAPDRLLRAAAAVLIGAATHLAWDSFTHSNSPIVERSTALRATVFGALWGGLPLYRLLQHGSSIAGAALLAAWYVQWYRRALLDADPPVVSFTPRLRALVAAALVAAGAIGGIAYSAIATPPESQGHYLHQLALHAVTATGGLTVAATICYSIAWHVAARRFKEYCEP